MINNYTKVSIGYRIMKHCNNYGVKLSSIFKETRLNLPALSIVIPYYESWDTINLTLEYLIDATKEKLCEIIIVDDGSVIYPAEKVVLQSFIKYIKIVKLKQNMGRSGARNMGLKEARNKVVAFMDADMLIPEGLIDKHLKLHAYFANNKKGCITFSLFNNLNINEWRSDIYKEFLFHKSNDFRKMCIYQPTWIGCKKDRKYIGNEYKIIEDTDYLKKWPMEKSYGPWLLPNMVLGGFFIVDRKKAIKVGGFSNFFREYGFTEIPLSTKLIAKFCDFVVPVDSPYLIHLHDGDVALSQKQRDYFFRKAHHLFFDVYLRQDLNETIKNEKI